jgi:hypothetical protein
MECFERGEALERAERADFYDEIRGFGKIAEILRQTLGSLGGKVFWMFDKISQTSVV